MVKKILQPLLSIFFSIVFYFDEGVKIANLERVSNLYDQGFSKLFAKIRIWDAPLEIIEKTIPKRGLIVDLGCGDGLIANYLALSESSRKIIGIEINPSRVKEAQKGVKNTQFLKGDILKMDFPQADIILLVHVLHHLSSYKDQAKLISRCKDKLKDDGSLIVVEIKERPVIKLLLTWVIDVFVFPILFEKKLFNFKIFYRSEKGWKTFLADAGFSVKVIQAHKNKPFSHLILYCQRGYDSP